MFYFYILKSTSKGTYYKGSCNDVPERLQRHNSGLVRSTKSGMPWSLVYQEAFGTLSEARKREKQIKSWKKREAIERLIKHF
ncbi:MAG: GIY-YIG nuclease family protein [Candidatus Kerfeldbacteria bacterium]|nr:GIY-YIG nuclease family protein [Candidatus Kerfeldbacteria bacterium]